MFTLLQSDLDDKNCDKVHLEVVQDIDPFALMVSNTTTTTTTMAKRKTLCDDDCDIHERSSAHMRKRVVVDHLTTEQRRRRDVCDFVKNDLVPFLDDDDDDDDDDEDEEIILNARAHDLRLFSPKPRKRKEKRLVSGFCVLCAQKASVKFYDMSAYVVDLLKSAGHHKVSVVSSWCQFCVKKKEFDLNTFGCWFPSGSTSVRHFIPLAKVRLARMQHPPGDVYAVCCRCQNHFVCKFGQVLRVPCPLRCIEPYKQEIERNNNKPHICIACNDRMKSVSNSEQK